MPRKRKTAAEVSAARRKAALTRWRATTKQERSEQNRAVAIKRWARERGAK